MQSPSYFSLPYFETSAATSQNVENAVDTLLDAVMKRWEPVCDVSLLNGCGMVFMLVDNHLNLLFYDDTNDHYYKHYNVLKSSILQKLLAF